MFYSNFVNPQYLVIFFKICTFLCPSLPFLIQLNSIQFQSSGTTTWPGSLSFVFLYYFLLWVQRPHMITYLLLLSSFQCHKTPGPLRSVDLYRPFVDSRTISSHFAKPITVVRKVIHDPWLLCHVLLFRRRNYLECRASTLVEPFVVFLFSWAVFGTARDCSILHPSPKSFRVMESRTFTRIQYV